MAHMYDDFKMYLCDKTILKERLPFPVYKKFRDVQKNEQTMDSETADALAHAMKVWALEKGATHYAHWFFPMTGSTAQKHDAFLEPVEDGFPMARFNGKALIKGEADGSSFPSGGLRATFEARGYTYWDITSPVFIRDHVLCIPSIFVSYHGESLDEKAPLLKSMDAVSTCATSLLHTLGYHDVKRVIPMLGQEQEYFLVDEALYKRRLDLKLVGRTLFGVAPSKGQDSEDHYFGSIPDKVMAFMQDVNHACWKLGIFSKVEHNEVAFNQFEIVPMYAPVHISIDQNQLIMDILKKTAKKHGLACLLHEKPFVGINGSGKHNNWSLTTNTNINLFDPGDSVQENIRFLLFVVALLKGIDQYAPLLRLASSSAGNDHRLGANEAPPAIISVYLGELLEYLLNDIENNTPTFIDNQKKQTPLKNLADIPTEFSDRNRTSPFAFTGSKFEFRMVGSSKSAALVHTILNTIMAQNIQEIDEALQQVAQEKRFDHAISIIKDTYKASKRILFNGDGYSQEWVALAKKRGLPNLSSFSESVDYLLVEDAVALFEKYHVLTSYELEARAEILHDQFVKAIVFESKTACEMIERQILPAAINELKNVGDIQSVSQYIKFKKQTLETSIDACAQHVETVKELLKEAENISLLSKKGEFMHNALRPQLQKLRECADVLEENIAANQYPIPTYTDLLFSFD